jgi:hypothetical protein
MQCPANAGRDGLMADKRIVCWRMTSISSNLGCNFAQNDEYPNKTAGAEPVFRHFL